MADTRLGKIGITVKEPWAADISYEVLDMTLYAVEDGGDGCSYVALKDNTGVTPGTDPTTWLKSTQAGQSIYDLAVKYHHFEGTEEEFEAEYQAVLQAARDAAAGASAVEAQVEAAEALRVEAETARETAESARQSAEASRASAETARGTAEAARQSAESGRASAETARVTAEQGRASAESDRVSAEAARAAAETDRVSDFSALKTDMETAIGQADAATAAAVATNNQIQTAEASRVSAEQGRVSAENARASAESARATAESGRATAETARVTAEGQRATAEGQRVTAENARVSAESGRDTAESARVTAEAARVSAETTRESQASSDHETAEADHTIVQGYDTRLTNVEGEVSQLGQEVDKKIIDNLSDDSTLAALLNLTERGSNILPTEMVALTGNKTITLDNQIAQSEISTATVMYLSVKEGDLLYITCPTMVFNNRLAYGLFQTLTDGSVADYCYHFPKQTWGGKKFIFTAHSDGYFAIYYALGASLTNDFSVYRLTPKGGSIPRRIDFTSEPGAIYFEHGTVDASIVSRRYTDYIDVSGIKKLLYTKHVTNTATQYCGMAFYTENKTYISGEQGGYGGVGDNNLAGYTLSVIDVPSTAKYARFTFWANRTLGDFFVMDADLDAISREIYVPLLNPVKDYPVAVPITGNYINLHDNPQTGDIIRANIYMPCNGGCGIKFVNKEQSACEYAISGFVVNSEHVPQSTSIRGYSSGSDIVNIPDGYQYVVVFFKKGNDDAITIEDVLLAYDIVFYYDKEVPSLTLKDNEIKWDFFGAFYQTDGRKISSDYVAIPKQFMKVRFDMPVWMRVRFRYGLREYAGWTGYYYSGDIVTFTREQSALLMELSLIDGRGLRVGIYDRDVVGNQMSLTILDEKDEEIITRSFDAEKYLGAIRTTPGVDSVDLPMLVHVSDIHGDALRFNSAFDYADYLGARLVINTGDNPFYVMGNGVKFHENVVLSHKTDFVNCLGNHDTYDSSIANIFNKNIAPFAEDYGYHKASGSDVTNECYFYKDLADLNLRIIVVNTYEGILTAAYKARISSTQFDWFISTLASTPAGYGVLVVMHQAPHTISAVTGKTDFNDSTMNPQIAAIDSDYMQYGKITGNPFGKVIDAFIAKGTVSGSYTQKNAAFTADETISYSADFTNLAEGVEFIAYLNGHTHRDFVGYVADCEHNQLNLNVCAVPPISQSTGYKTASDIMRDSNGANQDAFNVYTINRTDKTVGIARIGSSLSKDLRPRKVMFIPYAV